MCWNCRSSKPLIETDTGRTVCPDCLAFNGRIELPIPEREETYHIGIDAHSVVESKLAG